MNPPDRDYVFPVTPGGIPLHVCGWGAEAGRLTVILHGFLDQALAWTQIAHGLARRVEAPDHRGHGASGHVPEGGFYHFWDYVADLDAWLADQTEPVDLIGHSMGGSIAVLFAACRPEKVRRLVLVEGLGPPDASSKRVAQARTYLQHRRTSPRHPTMRSPGVALERMKRHTPSLQPAMARALAERVTEKVTSDTWTWSWDARHRCRNPHAFDALAFQDFLKAIQCPTLVIEGAASKIKLDDRDARLEALGPQQVTVLEDAGHQVHHDRPDPLVRALTHFLDLE